MIHIADMATQLERTAAGLARAISPSGEHLAVQQAAALLRGDRSMLFNSEYDHFAELCAVESLYAEAMLVVYKPAPRRFRTALVVFGQRPTRHHYMMVAGSVMGLTSLFRSEGGESLDGQVVIAPAAASLILVAKDKEDYGTLILTSPGLTCAQGLCLIDTGWAKTDCRHFLDIGLLAEQTH